MPGATLSEIVRAVETIDDPRPKVSLDIGNYYENDADVAVAIDRLSDRIVYIHLVDPTALGGALGAGEMPMDEIVDALDAVPGEVRYCFEFRGGATPSGRSRRARSSWPRETSDIDRFDSPGRARCRPIDPRFPADRLGLSRPIPLSLRRPVSGDFADDSPEFELR